MKPWRLVVVSLIIFQLSAFAQLKGARSYTQRALPETAPTNSASKGLPASPPKTGDPKKPAPPVVTTPPPPTVRVVPPPAPVDPDKAKAQKEEALRRTIEFQKKRAEQGSPSSQYDLALRYLTGDGVEKDEQAGRRWLETAAKAGHTPAIRKLQELGKKAP